MRASKSVHRGNPITALFVGPEAVYRFRRHRDAGARSRLTGCRGGCMVRDCIGRRSVVMPKRALFSGLFAAGLALCMVAALTTTNTAQSGAGVVPLDHDDIGGVVTGPHGPEAGVWVIAETTALPTRFVKIVVTDDAGRYVVPDLPKASYRVWVRGYGLVDSAKVQAMPGKVLNLTAAVAPDARAAAQYYP